MRKGSASIEVMLLLPIMLAVFILLIDTLFILYHRSIVEAEIDVIALNLRQQLAQAPDDYLLSPDSDLSFGNINSQFQTERGIFDYFHLGLSSGSIDTRFGQALANARGNQHYHLKSAHSSINFDAFRPQLKLSYQVEVHSPFSALTGNTLHNLRQVKGEIHLKLSNKFQHINDVRTLMDKLSEIEEVINLVKTARSEIKKWLSKIN